MNNGDIIVSASVAELIENRNTIKAKILAAFQTLSEAISTEMAVTSKKYSILESFLAGGRWHSASLKDPEDTMVHAMQQLDAGFWDALMEKSGIRAFMSAAKRDQWRDLISEGKTPPFEMDSIKATFADLYEKRADMMEEGMIDLFQRLSWNYKTNNPVRMEKKLIVERVLNSYGMVNNSVTNELDDLVRILSVYDGKPIPEHRHGMYAVIADAMAQKDSVVDTEYFTIKVFKKGSGHIVFKDNALPLLDQCNRVIAKAFPDALPAASGRKAA
ncbi:DUF4942 domain-containing protein [Acidithiobacillus concretivorus]|uniref:DUF4942 domain-containing protein n=1 Tax=Acidithiobacillus concretivorus TaxID=3063952 RepID=A0ABS5ZQG7_9PROT|nr:DUF4942 domain-containing protein [Acidithiobacillus concretivorus]MBU2738705.1 DUF4942 domain-containing protein [Acidithiobacillus concretivorus]